MRPLLNAFFLIGRFFSPAYSLFSIAIALVPTFLQFRRTLQKLEVFIDALNKRVDPLCQSLTEAANEIQLVSISIGDKLDKTDAVIYTAQKSADTLLTTSTMIKETVRPFITQIGGFSAGVMAFSHFLNRSWKTSKKGE
jgi:ABC-type transporter Mla subunit MlaD